MSSLPHEPFDADEAELARAYRVLPAGEPSPALDAAILAKARAGLAGSGGGARRRRRPWYLGAGFGTAAAAVMAAGLAWQFGWRDGQESPVRDARLEVPAAAEPEPERIDIEFIREESRATDVPTSPRPASVPVPPPHPAESTPPSPPPEPAPARERAAMPETLPAPPPAPASPPLPAPASPGNTLESKRALESGPRPEPFPADLVPQANSPQAPASSAPPAAAAETSAAAPVADAEFDRVRGIGGRIAAPAADTTGGAGQQRQGAPLPPWTDDARLAPDLWLQRIRERVMQADRSGAQNSLKRFVLTHPERRVPRDLQRLLVE